MKKYLSLVKLLFVQQYKSRASSERDGRKRRVGTAVLYVILALCFLPIALSVAVAIYYMGKVSGGDPYICMFLTLMCQGLVFMFGVHAIMSNVFIVKDADKLLYLPVRAPVIFLAKLTVAYLNELITTFVTVLVILLPFGIGAHIGAAYYLLLPVALLLIPMLPMLLGALVAMPLSALIARFAKNSVIKTVLRIVIYALLMALYMYIVYRLGFLTGSENGNILDNPEAYAEDILRELTEQLSKVMVYFHPNYLLVRAMTGDTFVRRMLYLLASIGENAALLGLVFAVSLPFYRAMLGMTADSGGRRRMSGYNVHSKGTVAELMRTDLRRTVRDSQMGFQSFAGLVIMPVIVVLLYFMMGLADEGGTSFIELMRVSPLYQAIAPTVILIYMTMLNNGTNVLGLYPISRENRSIFMLKCLPVPFGKILLAKVLLATAVMAINSLITCVLIVALFGLKWYFGLAMLCQMLTLGFGSMCITTLADLKCPRLGWDNFNQNLKNAKNSWLAMLVALVCAVALAAVSAPCIVLYALFGGWYWLLIMWLVSIGLGIGFAAVAYRIMKGKAAYHFGKIEV